MKLGPRDIGTGTQLLGAAGVAVSLGAAKEWSTAAAWISGVVLPLAGALLKLGLDLNRSSDTNRKRDDGQDRRLDELEGRVKKLETAV